MASSTSKSRRAKSAAPASSATSIPVDPAIQAESHLSSTWNGTAGASETTLVEPYRVKTRSPTVDSFNSSELEEFATKKKRVPGCCCCYSVSGRLICAAVTLILLGGLGVAAYFLYPRIPASSDITINSANIKPANVSNPFIIDNSKPANPRLQTTLLVPIRVKSHNYIPWPIAQLNIVLFLKTQIGRAAIAEGNLDNFVIQPKTTTTLSLPLLLNYTVTNDEASSYVLSTVLDKCGVTNGKRDNLLVDYVAKVKLSFGALSDALPQPTFSGSTSFACPISEADLQKAINDLNLST